MSHPGRLESLAALLQGSQILHCSYFFSLQGSRCVPERDYIVSRIGHQALCFVSDVQILTKSWRRRKRYFCDGRDVDRTLVWTNFEISVTIFTAVQTCIWCNRWIRMNIFKTVLWAVTFSLVHMYQWSGIWRPAVWCICTSELGEAALFSVWVSAVIQTSNYACRFFGCLTFWHMMQKINLLLYVFEHLVCGVNVASSYADMTLAQRCLRIYCALYMTLCCSLRVLQCVTGAQCLHLQEQAVYLDCLALKVKAVWTFEMPCRLIPEDSRILSSYAVRCNTLAEQMCFFFIISFSSLLFGRCEM